MRCAGVFTTLAAWLFAGAVYGQAPALLDVGNQFHIATTNERTTLNRTTGELISTVDVTLFNLGGRSLLGPVHLVVRTTNPDVLVINAAGNPQDPLYGAYYRDLSGQLFGNRLLAGQVLETTLEFRRPRHVDLAYELEPRALLEQERVPRLTVFPFVSPIVENERLTIEVEADDPDGSPVILLAEPAISNAHFAATSGVNAAGTFVFAPTNGQAGIYTLRFSARDPLGLTTSVVVEIEVLRANRRPTVDALEPRVITAGDAVIVAVSAEDPDGDPLALSANPLPDNAVFSSAARTFLFTPALTQTGLFTIGFVASDGTLNSATQNLDVTVLPPRGADPADTNQLVLVVDPVQSPSLVARQRITGFVNAGTSQPPVSARSALITGLNPATVTAGQRTNLVITGQASGLFETHFDMSSLAQIGNGITVERVVSAAPHTLVVGIRVATNAAPGPRGVTVVTSNETAISLVALNVGAPSASITGVLRDPDTGLPIAGARITIQGTGFSTVTGLDGSFTFLGVPPGAGVLIVNSPNYELLRIAFEAILGETQEIGELTPAPTVFNPSAPATVSLLSVLGRGVGSMFGGGGLDELKRSVIDTLLLVGGTEAGVLDEFGNQLNPDISGVGLISMSGEGVRLLAQKMQRGTESVSLGDLLFSISHGLRWENESPPTLAEWLEALQEIVNAAWANPNVPDNQMPILLFNRGNRLLPEPPELSPETRLSPMQAFLFMSSLWTMLFTEPSPNAGVVSMPEETLLARWGSALWSLMGPATAYGDSPPPAPDRRFTKFWRGLYQQRNDYLIGSGGGGIIGGAFQGYLMGVSQLAMPGANLLGLQMNFASANTLLGPVMDNLGAALGVAALAAQVPEPPPDRSVQAQVVVEEGAVSVVVQFDKSRSHTRTLDSQATSGDTYIYSLWRFRDANGPRDLVDFSVWNKDTIISLPLPGGAVEQVRVGGLGQRDLGLEFFDAMKLRLRDSDPLPATVIGGQSARPGAATWFYSITTTRVRGPAELDPNMMSLTAPWWSLPLQGSVDGLMPFYRRTKNQLVSDYSVPVVVRVTAQGAPVAISEIEVDPRLGDVYVSEKQLTGTAARIVRVTGEGEGPRTTFAFTGFAPPGHNGLAIDRSGNLLSVNAASEARFGGRVFQYDQPAGTRSHVGALNYFSQLLMNANPAASGPMAMGPGWIPSNSAEDLYVVDELPNVVKKVPVQARYDAGRRIGQPWAEIPVKAVNSDLEVDEKGDAHLLVRDITQPLLTVNLWLSDSFVSPSAVVTARIQVANAGPFTVSNIEVLPLFITGEGAVSAVSVMEPSGISLLPSQQGTFSIVYRANQPGMVYFQAAAQGVDGNGTTIGSQSGPVPPRPLEIGSPLRVVSLEALPRQVAPGGTIEATMRVLNRGNASFTAVTSLVFDTFALFQSGPTGSVSVLSGPTPAAQTIGAGGFVDYTWSFTAVDMGFVGFRGRAGGMDQQTASHVVTPTFIGNNVTISPLAVSLTADPLGIRRGATNVVTVTLTVSNSGASAVNQVTPTLEQVFGQGQFTGRAPSSHAPVNVGPGAKHDFIYTYTGPTNSGLVRLRGHVTAQTGGGQEVPSDFVDLDLTIGPVIRGKISDVRLLVSADPANSFQARVQENVGAVAGVRLRAIPRGLGMSTNSAGEAVSDAQGNFVIPLEDAGIYDLLAIHTNSGLGFRREGIVAGNEAIVRDFTLPVSLFTTTRDLVKAMTNITMAIDLKLGLPLYTPTNILAYSRFTPKALEFLDGRIALGEDTPPYLGIASDLDAWHAVARLGVATAFAKRRYVESANYIQLVISTVMSEIVSASKIKETVKKRSKLDLLSKKEREELKTYMDEVKTGGSRLEFLAKEFNAAIDRYFAPYEAQLGPAEKFLKEAIKSLINWTVKLVVMAQTLDYSGLATAPIDAVVNYIVGEVKAAFMQGLFIDQFTEPALVRMVERLEQNQLQGGTLAMFLRLSRYDIDLLNEFKRRKDFLGPGEVVMTADTKINVDTINKLDNLGNQDHSFDKFMSDLAAEGHALMAKKFTLYKLLSLVGPLTEAGIFEPGRVCLVARYLVDDDPMFESGQPLSILVALGLEGGAAP